MELNGGLMNEAEMRQRYADLEIGDRVEVVHQVKICFRVNFEAHTVGTVVKKERRQCGIARNWDDKYWFDHLVLRKEDCWVVADVLDGGRLLLQTRRGKMHEIATTASRCLPSNRSVIAQELGLKGRQRSALG